MFSFVGEGDLGTGGKNDEAVEIVLSTGEGFGGLLGGIGTDSGRGQDVGAIFSETTEVPGEVRGGDRIDLSSS